MLQGSIKFKQVKITINSAYFQGAVCLVMLDCTFFELCVPRGCPLSNGPSPFSEDLL